LYIKYSPDTEKYPGLQPYNKLTAVTFSENKETLLLFNAVFTAVTSVYREMNCYTVTRTEADVQYLQHGEFIMTLLHILKNFKQIPIIPQNHTSPQQSHGALQEQKLLFLILHTYFLICIPKTTQH
jgi:hypothetical protein